VSRRDTDTGPTVALMELRSHEIHAPHVDINGGSSNNNSQSSMAWSLVGGELSPDHDEALSVNGLVVTWTSCNRVVLTAEAPSDGGPVLQACFAYFADFRTTLLHRRRYSFHCFIIIHPSTLHVISFIHHSIACGMVWYRWLCVLQRLQLNVYGPDGDHHWLALPCPIAAMWPMLEGLLLERPIPPAPLVVTPISSTPLPSSSSSSSSGGGGGGISLTNNDEPTLFSLMHPLEELKPLSFWPSNHEDATDDVLFPSPSSSSSSSHDATNNDDNVNVNMSSRWVTDAYERVVQTFASQPLLVTYNERTRRHALWQLRQSPGEIAKRQRAGLIPIATAAPSRSETSTTVPTTIAADTRTLKLTVTTTEDELARVARRSSINVATLSQVDDTRNDDHNKTGDATTSSGEIEPELWLERCWRDTFPRVRCSSTFLCSGADRSPMLAMFTASSCSLLLYQMSSTSNATNEPSLEPLRLLPPNELSCRAAVPVHAAWTASIDDDPNPYNYHILLLDTNGQLVLYTGHRRLAIVDHLPFIVASTANGNTKEANAPTASHATSSPLVPMDISASHSSSPSSRPPANPSSSSSLTSPSVENMTRFDTTASIAIGTPTIRRAAITTATSLTPNNNNNRPNVSPLSSFGNEQFAPGTPDFMDSDHHNGGLATTIVDIRDAVSNRITLLLGDNRLYRGSLATHYNNACVQSCSTALAAVWPTELYHSFRVDFIVARRYWASQTPSLRDDWVIFTKVWYALVSRAYDSKASLVDNKSKIERKNDAANDDDEAWLSLMDSDYHADYVHKHAIPMLSSSQRPMSTTAIPKVSHAPIITDMTAFKLHLTNGLVAMHLVYQDCKLNTLRASTELRPLASLLVSIATCIGRYVYVDHYKRDFGDIAPFFTLSQSAIITSPTSSSSSSSSTIASDTPADIYQWLSTCLRASRSLTSTLSSYPLLDIHHDSPCDTSRRICHFYDVLTAPIGSGMSRYSPNAPLHTGDLNSSILIPSSSSTPSLAPWTVSMSNTLAVPLTATICTPLSPFAPSRYATPRRPILRAIIDTIAHATDTSTVSIGDTPKNRRRSNVSYLGSVNGASAAAPPLFSPSTVQRRVPVWSAHSSSERLVLAMVDEGYTQRDMDTLPYGISLPLREALRVCRSHVPGHWPRAAYELVGRHDIARTMMGTIDDEERKTTNNNDVISSVASIAGVSDVEITEDDGHQRNESISVTETNNNDSSDGINHDNNGHDHNDDDGTLRMTRLCGGLLFDIDMRLKEVRRVLRCNRLLSVGIAAARMAELTASNQDPLGDQRERLAELATRTLSLSIGRGMYTVASIIPSATDSVVIPTLELNGRLPPRGQIIEFDDGLIHGGADALMWPSFHNGTAAGLRVSTTPLTRNWILYALPVTQRPTPSTGGWLMALGLQGHLTKLANIDLFKYYNHHHEHTTIGINIGMAAAKRSSMDQNISRALCQFVQPLIPFGYGDARTPSSAIQSSALIGIGMLYQGSAHRLMTEVPFMDSTKLRLTLKFNIKRDVGCIDGIGNAG
jgi:hypothetical protein